MTDELKTPKDHAEAITVEDKTMKHDDKKSWVLHHPNAEECIGASEINRDDRVSLFDHYVGERKQKPTVTGCDDLTSAKVHAVMIWEANGVEMDADAVCKAILQQ